MSLLKQFVFTSAIAAVFFSCSQKQEFNMDKAQLTQLRLQMVERQIEARGVKDSLLIRAMQTVPRHIFIPKEHWNEAYLDHPVPIGEGQTISQPYIVAFMTEQLHLKTTDRVLEIGTGSGYQAAVLGQIVDSVFTIEILPELARKARATLEKLAYKNIIVRQGDGYHGWKDKAPFDAIIVTAAPPKIPPVLLEELKVGGVMVLPVGEYVQELVVVHKTSRGMEMQNVLPVRFVPMTGDVRKQIKK